MRWAAVKAKPAAYSRGSPATCHPRPTRHLIDKTFYQDVAKAIGDWHAIAHEREMTDVEPKEIEFQCPNCGK